METIEPLGETTFRILASVPSGRSAADPGRRRHVRRLSSRALRPGRPALPLPVRQLHQLRPAVHDRPLRAVRPPEHDHGRLPAVRRLPAGVRGPRRSPLPRRAGRVPGLRASAVDAARGGGCAARQRRNPRGQGPRRLPPSLRRDERERGGATSGAQAPRGEAVRRDDPPTRTRSRRDRCRGASAPGGRAAADRPRSARAQTRAVAGVGRAAEPLARLDAPVHARSTTSCAPTSAGRS